jgi:hypothetical protein
MKTIKFLGICLLTMVLAMGFQSCSKDEYHSRLKELIIKDLTFASSKDTNTKEFRNEDLSCFSVISNADWCTAAIDVKKSTLTVTVEKNTTYDSRVATITIRDIVDNTSTRTFTVTQAQQDCIRLKDKTQASQEMPTEGGQIALVVETNVNYEWKSDVAWIHKPKSSTRGLVESTIMLEVDKNTTGKERTGTVKVVNAASGLEAQVTVTQVFTGFLKITDPAKTKTIEIDETGGSVSIGINTNVAFDTDIDPVNWLKSEGREQIDDENWKQKLKISPLTDKIVSRTAEITFKAKDDTYGIEPQTIVISQSRSLFIKDDDITLLPDSVHTIELYNATGSKVTWTATSISPKDVVVAKVDATGKVTGVTPGTAKVTVTTEDGAHTDNIIVTVKEPAALTTLKGSMKRKTKTVDGVEDILYSITSKLENTSNNNIVLTKVTLFCDGKALTNDTPDPAAELLAKVGSYESQFDIEIEYEEVEVEVEKEKETTDETKTDDTKAENGSSDSSSNGTRYGVRRSRTRADGDEGGSGSGSEAGDGDSESGSDSGSEGEAGDGDDKEGEGEKPATEKVKRPKVNTHTYVVVWTYTYAGKEFTFQYPQTVQTTTSRAGVRRARSRR